MVQPALFTMNLALAHVASLGLQPQAVVGHSQGEVAAAVFCGALTLQQGAQVVACRSQALLTVAGQGAMAVVEQPEHQVDQMLQRYGGRLSVAVVNSEAPPRSPETRRPSSTCSGELGGAGESSLAG